jgi:wyosine [tRNA(Phe)-imidazoG37] synthetase (radical SAM superfamily)
MTDYRYLFGPVPSRRFGWSLGIDPVPVKTCSQSCIFCQLGRTAVPTVTRREYVPTDDVLDELRRWHEHGGHADVVTLAGSGEPTLHTHFGEMIRFAQRTTGQPCVLLTNGSLLYQPGVCEAAAPADIIKVTLSAWDQASYEKLHRPHPEATFERLLEGERRLRGMCEGQFWVEVFLVRGLNDSQEALARLAETVGTLSPDRIHLNTVVRPPSEASAERVSDAVLRRAADGFGPHAEVVASFKRKSGGGGGEGVSAAQIFALLARHPGTLEQIQQASGATHEQASRICRELEDAGRIYKVEREGENYYVVNSGAAPDSPPGG